jgi:hypothetical protein
MRPHRIGQSNEDVNGNGKGKGSHNWAEKRRRVGSSSQLKVESGGRDAVRWFSRQGTFAGYWATMHEMELSSRRKDITSRVIRQGDPPPADEEWKNTTPEERINAVWDLTLLCLAWQKDSLDEPRLQRSLSRIERPGR